MVSVLGMSVQTFSGVDRATHLDDRDISLSKTFLKP